MEFKSSDPFEQALIDVQQATDGRGNRVRIEMGDFSSVFLKKTLREFAKGLNENEVFIDIDGLSVKSEVAFYRILALMARAVAASLEHEQKKPLIVTTQSAEHIESEQCWCHPTLEYTEPETGTRVWKHHQPS